MRHGAPHHQTYRNRNIVINFIRYVPLLKLILDVFIVQQFVCAKSLSQILMMITDTRDFEKY